MKKIIKKIILIIGLYIILFFVISTIRFAYRHIDVKNKVNNDEMGQNFLSSVIITHQWKLYFKDYRIAGFDDSYYDYGVVAIHKPTISFYTIPLIFTVGFILVYELVIVKFDKIKNKFNKWHINYKSKTTKERLRQIEEKTKRLEKQLRKLENKK